MKSESLLSKILSILLSVLLFLSLIPVSVSASPVDVFDGVESAPVNKNATQVAKNFYQYLWNVRKSDSVIVGATSSSLYGLDTAAADAEHDYYKALVDYFGVTPAIFAPFKSISYQMENNYLPVVVERYQNGSIPLFHIHGQTVTDVVDKGEVEDPSDTIVHLDKTNPNRDMTLYNDWMAELKKTADYFEEVEKAGIEVYIFKMFSEMNNTNKKGAFGASEKGYEAFHHVWQQAVEYFTVERGLKGILFAYCPAGFTGSEPLYPGDDYVDILAPTSYANNATGPIYETYGCVDYSWMKHRPKPFGFSELGGRGLNTESPIGDYKETLESIIYAYPETTFAVLWYENRLSLFPPGDFSNNGNYNGDYFIYSSQAIVAEEMPDLKSGTPVKSTGIATFYAKKDLNERLISLTLGEYSSKKLKSLSFKPSDVKSLNVLHGCAIAVYETENCSGVPQLYYGATNIVSDTFEKAKSFSVIKLENVAFEKDIWLENHTQSAFSLNDGQNSEWTFEKDDQDESVSIVIDLGQVYNIGQMSINHAGFYDNFKYNLRDFAAFTSLDGNNYTMVYEKYGNVLPSSNFSFQSIDARYVKLKIITPNSSAYEIEKNLVSLAEIEVYGTDAVGTYGDSDWLSTDPNGGTWEQTDFVDSTDISENTEYGKEDITVSTVEEKQEAQGIVIPEFYNYVWIIVCGGIVFLAASVGFLLFLLHKRKMKKAK